MRNEQLIHGLGRATETREDCEKYRCGEQHGLSPKHITHFGEDDDETWDDGGDTGE